VVLLGNPIETGTEREEGGRRKKRTRDEGKKVRKGGVTDQASVHSSGSACVGLEGHR